MVLVGGGIQIRTIYHLPEDGSQLPICTVRKKKLSPIPDAASERV